ncbi:hypothetical protein JMF89_11400 [Clostridiaceae bacterium UIB06]|uniref:Uncharacterized protein n=1 Tax=Clostridium thailandense TaxID=2794346 RepID=A0A949WU64_9CLOT|nr:hypothetical protein [Clostridium thailandense]MBV7272257.1 hypothetical protein [Clostridium thailandense]MCH5137803.1 hypothetical protein [Clostridiaceae bacterium UIB06]
MEFRLNKVDPEVRQRVKETTSAGKIHTKSGIVINKDNQDKKNKNGESFSAKLEKEKKDKKRLSVDAVKIEEVEVSAYKEERENTSNEEDAGHLLDVRR